MSPTPSPIYTCVVLTNHNLSLSSAFSLDADETSLKPIYIFTAHEGPVYSMVSTDHLLISGGTGIVKAWNWSDLIRKTSKEVWSKKPPFRSTVDVPEINCMLLNEKAGFLMLGCGDSRVYMLDLESGTCKLFLSGHTDYVHCLAQRDQIGEVLSGSEDGTVRHWDCRTGGMVQCINVSAQKDCARPEIGSWIGCLATDSDWMVCGGGPLLSLWHLRSVTPAAVFALPGSHHAVRFYEDLIIAAGTSRMIDHCQVNGQVRSRIPCSLPFVYSLAASHHCTERQLLTAAGGSHKIDAFINLGYRAFSLAFS
uniref:THO complex 6 n=1 Tax=Eptatretus burgeri TaxID=7764 RepID=A0A8C4PXR7_EPTBU